jgi:hypothetical protein
VSSIGAKPLTFEVGVATEDGRSYYQITSLLKSIHVPYVDIIIGTPDPSIPPRLATTPEQLPKNLKLVITTRRERLRVPGGNISCIEDLGEDVAVAKQRIFSALYSSHDADWFVVGIDPGERTGVAAFFGDHEVESSVAISVDDTLTRVEKLLDNAKGIRRIVRIGSGIPELAIEIARRLDLRYKKKLRIQLVDERGTSALSSRRGSYPETRDQKAAKLIAFREGEDYISV